MKKLSHSSYGADRRSLLILDHSLIRSKLDYASVVYSTAAETDLNSLNSVHHAALRLATGAFRTSPIQRLLHEAGEWSLTMRRDYLSAAFLVHLESTPNLPMSELFHLQERHTAVNSPNFLQRSSGLFLELGLEATQTMKTSLSILPPWAEINIKIDLSLHSIDRGLHSYSAMQSTFKDQLKIYPNSILLYTDASRSTIGTVYSIVKDENTL